MFALNVWGLHTISFVQTNFEGWANFFTYLSTTIANPEALYLVYFPVVYPFDCGLGIKLVQATVFGDWLNLIMKWLLMEDRPYWWIHENNLVDSIHVRQFYNTCETGPGNPSGHVAITGIAWYILTKGLIDKVEQNYKVNISIPAWTAYILAMLTLGMSRVYIAAHFPHQVLFGFSCAILSGKLLSSMDLKRLTCRHYLLAAVFGFASAIFVDCALDVSGIDVKWTIKLAQKWCQDPSWVHLSTSPYYIMWRFVGIAAGVGFVATSDTCKNLDSSSSSTAKRTILSVSGLLAARTFYHYVPKEINDPLMYIVMSACYAFFIHTVGVGVPLLLCSFN